MPEGDGIGAVVRALEEGDFSIAVRALLQDLTLTYPNDGELFRDLFYDRHSEKALFEMQMSRAKETRDNITIIGDPGVGKTSFLLSIISDADLVKRLNICPVLVDYRQAPVRSPDGCLIQFVDNMKAAFESMKQSIVLGSNVPEKIDENLVRIMQHIRKLDQKRVPHPLIAIFLDDFDYAETTWFELLDRFFPFAEARSTIVVLTVRPPLLAAIEAYDDRYRFQFAAKVNTISLKTLPAREVLVSRLAPVLLDAGESTSVLAFVHKLFRKRTAAEALLHRLGIKDITSLQQFAFPLTEKFIAAMEMISNGNMREIFNIAYDALMYIAESKARLRSRVEDGIERKVIGRDASMELFCGRTDDDSPRGTYRIMNLHENRSAAGASLLYNTMEVIRLRMKFDEITYGQLEQLGHTADKVHWAIGHMTDKAIMLAEPRHILPPNRKAALELYDDYRLTTKGKYYFELAREPVYMKRFGEPGPTIEAQRGGV